MYIDSGTFWAFIISLGVAIGIVYYMLNKKIAVPSADYKKDLDEAIRKLAHATTEDIKNLSAILSEELTSLQDKHEKDIIAIRGRLIAPEDIEKMAEKAVNDQHKANKKSLNEISELYARIANLEKKTGTKPPKIKASSAGDVVAKDN